MHYQPPLNFKHEIFVKQFMTSMVYLNFLIEISVPFMGFAVWGLDVLYDRM